MGTTSVIKESTVKDFLEVIFRRKWIILGVVCVSTILVMFLNFREQAVYESTGKMLVKRGETAGVFNNAIRTLTWEEEIASQIEMVKSQVVIDGAKELIRKYLPEDYMTDAEINYNSVGSGVITRSNVLWVSYTDLDPVFCEASANAIINSYKDYYQRVRTPPEMEDFFSEELNIVKDDLEYWRERKVKLEKEWGLVDIDTQSRNTLERMERYQTDLDVVRQDILYLEGIIENLANFRDLDIETLAAITVNFTETTSKRSALESYKEKLIDLKMKESEMSVMYTEDHKELKKVKNQISDIYALMESEITAAIDIQKRRLSILNDKETSLSGMLADITIEKNAYPEREVELDRIDKAIAGLEIRYSKLQEQHMSSRISVASNPEWSITILAPASRAAQKKTRDYVRMALGPLFSLVIALGFAFFVDNLDHSIKNVSEAEELLGLQVLSSFPDLDRK